MDYLKYSSTDDSGQDYDKKFNSVHTTKNEVNENTSFIYKSNHIKRVRNRTASDTDVAISENGYIRKQFLLPVLKRIHKIIQKSTNHTNLRRN